MPKLLFIRSLLAFLLTNIASQNVLAGTPKVPLPFPAVKERVALVIGNAEYSTVSLKNPVNDAQTLSKLGFEVDFYANLDQAAMVQHVFDFYHHKAAKSQLRVVYFAGHGVQFEGRNYLLPVDANLAIPAEIP
jgi:uncharacterized caspase-like protein